MHLRRVGYHFTQIGGSFFVHYPHEKSPSARSWEYTGRRKLNDILFEEFKEWLEEEVPDDTVASSLRCPKDIRYEDFGMERHYVSHEYKRQDKNI